mgnify:FL=1
MYQNVRGLNTKMTKLFSNSFDFDHHVIIFTETWLKDNVFDSELLCNKYQIFRFNRNDRNGGGVLIAISCLFQSEVISHDNSLSIEFISVVIKLKYKRIFITCSYIPPNSDETVYLKHAEAIKTTTLLADTNDSVFVFGDFNLPSIIWKYSTDAPDLIPITTKNSDDEFLKVIFDHSLYQMNDIHNSSGKLLDLVFVNDLT